MAPARGGAAAHREALAGTVANHQEDAEGAATGRLADERRQNQRENMLVVEDICQRLQSGASTLDVLPPQVVEAA